MSLAKIAGRRAPRGLSRASNAIAVIGSSASQPKKY
jgi:hypothetical protein